jgi:hypothetical protein
MMGGQITDAATTGAAETLKDHVTLTADADTAMDDTTIASPSRIRITVETAAITTAGTLDLVGEDVNGNAIFEQVIVGLLGIGEYVTSGKQFKKLYRVYNTGIRSTTGTLVIASIAGASTYTVGAAPKYYDLEFGGLDSVTGNYIKVFANNCWTNSSGMAAGDASHVFEDAVGFTIEDLDADLSIADLITG